MKKKIFNATVGGYYIVSVVLGIVMALTFCLMMCDLWYSLFERQVAKEEEFWQNRKFGIERTELEQAIWNSYEAESKRLDDAWAFVPLGSSIDGLAWSLGTSALYSRYVPIALVTSAMTTIVFSVIIMEGKSANKAWRQKMSQAVAIASLIVLVIESYQCARWRGHIDGIETWTILVPVALTIIPLISLKKTRIRKEDKVIIGDMGGMMPGKAIAAEIVSSDQE